MQKVKADFVTVSENGVVQKIGTSLVAVPQINYNGQTTKWFDDERLRKDRGQDNARKDTDTGTAPRKLP